MGTFNKPNLNLFWDFITERQSIYHKKVVQQLAPPWTNDPVLRDFFFTNVYRRVDPGTEFIVENVLETITPKPDKIFNTMLYRYCGSQDITFKEIGFSSLKSWRGGRGPAPKMLAEGLRRVRDMGIPPFGYAYTVSPYGLQGDKIDIITNMFKALAEMFDTFYALIVSAENAQEAFEHITKALGFGPFLSWQVLVDITYPLKVYNSQPLLNVNINEWAMAGPGARRGIQHILKPDAKVSDLRVMKFLHKKQTKYLVPREFDWLSDYDGSSIPLGLADIQNCFCEFSKYYKIKKGLENGKLPKGRIRKYDQQ